MTRQEYFAKLKREAIGRKASSTKYASKRRLRVDTLDPFTEFVMEECSLLAQDREEITGMKWHIDHIVPLFHKDACGLHVAANLQVVPAWWNHKKRNFNMDEYIIAGY